MDRGRSFAIALWAGIFVSGQSETNVIRACADVKGTLRLLAAGASCGNQETFVSWNVTGPQGPAGAAGAQGAQGPPRTPGDGGPRGRGSARRTWTVPEHHKSLTQMAWSSDSSAT